MYWFEFLLKHSASFVSVIMSFKLDYMQQQTDQTHVGGTAQKKQTAPNKSSAKQKTTLQLPSLSLMDQVWIVYYPIHTDCEKELWQYQDEYLPLTVLMLLAWTQMSEQGQNNLTSSSMWFATLYSWGTTQSLSWETQLYAWWRTTVQAWPSFTCFQDFSEIRSVKNVSL